MQLKKRQKSIFFSRDWCACKYGLLLKVRRSPAVSEDQVGFHLYIVSEVDQAAASSNNMPLPVETDFSIDMTLAPVVAGEC